MTLLVTYASKHGSTQEIAERIAAKLRQMGQTTDVHPVDEVLDAGSYTAFVIGSAIYYGSWLKEATGWVHRNQAVLAEHPVWLFSAGPLGTEVQDTEPQPKEQAEFQQAIKPREQRIFFGVLDHNHLSFTERMMVKAIRAPRRMENSKKKRHMNHAFSKGHARQKKSIDETEHGWQLALAAH